MRRIRNDLVHECDAGQMVAGWTWWRKDMAPLRRDRWPHKGLQKEKATGRRNAVAKLVESAGGKLEAFYFAFGRDDGIAIYDLPDNVTAVSLSIAANSAGHVHLSITPLITVEEMDRAIEKSAKYHIPG
jgi:uncharacterized protein with GYD domain